jgi:hypothetical protein
LIASAKKGDKMKPEERFEILNNFLGYGNVDTAKILFIGIEERGSWTKDNISLMEYNKTGKVKKDTELKCLIDRRLNVIANRIEGEMPYLTKEEWTDKTWSKHDIHDSDFKTTEKIQTYLSLRLQGEKICNLNCGLEYWKDGYNRNISGGFCSSIEFQTNIFPLGVKSENAWNDEEYPSLFNVPPKKEDYRKKCINKRLDVLKKLIKILRENTKKRNERVLIFVMGAEPECYLKPALNTLGWFSFPTENCCPNDNDLTSKICRGNRPLTWSWSKCESVWFLGHPSYGWVNKEVIDWIVNKLGKSPFNINQ